MVSGRAKLIAIVLLLLIAAACTTLIAIFAPGEYAALAILPGFGILIGTIVAIITIADI